MFSALLIGTGGWYSRRCRLTWNLKGTKYNRLYFRLRVSTLPTEGTGFGLLPTPTSVQRDHPERVEKLKATGAKTMMSRAAGENRPNSILDAVNFYGMLPTPTAVDYKGAYRPESMKDKTGKFDRTQKLANIYTKIKGHQYNSKTSQLNPHFVLEMMGFPPNWTELPFQSGETNQSKPQATP